MVEASATMIRCGAFYGQRWRGARVHLLIGIGPGRTWQPTKVTRVIRTLGTSTGTVIAMTDAGEAYVKTLGNPEGPSSLVSELIGTRLAAWLGLPTFDFAIVPFDADLLPVDYAHGCRALSGPAFASRSEAGRPWSGHADDFAFLENPEMLSGLVLLDTWIRNRDRHSTRGDEVRRNLNNVFFTAEQAGGRCLPGTRDRSHRCLSLRPRALPSTIRH